MIKISKLFLIFLIIPFIAWSLTFKDGKQVDDSISETNTSSNNDKENFTKLDNPKNWPSGFDYVKEQAENAILYFDEAQKPKRLFLSSSRKSSNGFNIAYKGPQENPSTPYGFWPKGAVSTLVPADFAYLTTFFYEDEIDDLVDGNDHVNRGFDENKIEPLSYHLQRFYSGDLKSLEILKDFMLELVDGPYWKALIPDRNAICTTCMSPMWEGYNFSMISELWFNLITMMEVHLTLIREDIYSNDEQKRIHAWIEKRVWLAEQGPDDGQLAGVFRWTPDPGPTNHHGVQKILGYLMWGIVDKNSEYFTAGVRGFEDYYELIRSDGSLSSEVWCEDASREYNRGGHGCMWSLSKNSETSKNMMMAAIALYNQGIDVQKKYPLIEKNIEWTVKTALDPNYAKKYIQNDTYTGEIPRYDDADLWIDGVAMDWIQNGAGVRKNISHIFYWDSIFGTKYSRELDHNFNDVYDDIEARRASTFGIIDTLHVSLNSNAIIEGRIDLDFQTDLFNLNYSKGQEKPIYDSESDLFKLVGDTSEKFTIEPVDCDSSNNGDCASNQQRLVMVEKEIMKPGDVKTYKWSMYLPEDHKNIYKTNVAYAFFEGEAGCDDPVAINEFEGGYFFTLADHFQREREVRVVEPEDAVGKWNNFELEIKWSKKDDGILNLIVNGEEKVSYKGPTLDQCEGFYFNYGIVRRGLNKSDLAKNNSTTVFFDNISVE